jgi:hypothetical protein
MSSCASDRDRIACIFDAYNQSKEVASKKLEALAAKDDFHVGITLVFLKSRKATAYLQVHIYTRCLLGMLLQYSLCGPAIFSQCIGSLLMQYIVCRRGLCAG